MSGAQPNSHTASTPTMVTPEPDEPLVDTALAEEIALLGEVVAAVTSIGRRLSDAEVDEALGLPVPQSDESDSPRQD
jgi:hypothetical protein